MRMRTALILTVMTILGIGTTGCRAVSECTGYYADRWDSLRRAKAARREAIRAEHDADCWDQQEAISAEAVQFEDQIRSKLAMTLDQQFEIGQLQVNEEKMLDWLEKRREEREAIQAIQSDQEAEYRKALIEAIRGGADPQAVMAGNGYCVPEPTCLVPQPVLPPEPVQAPITPEQIEFVLPVKLTVGVGKSSVEAVRVERQPVRSAPEAVVGEGCVPSCDTCPPACVAPGVCVPPGAPPTTLEEMGSLIAPPFHTPDQLPVQANEATPIHEAAPIFDLNPAEASEDGRSADARTSMAQPFQVAQISHETIASRDSTVVNSESKDVNSRRIIVRPPRRTQPPLDWGDEHLRMRWMRP